MWDALRYGSPPPPELLDYQIGVAFWRNLGIKQSDLDEWPEEKIDRYLTVMEVVNKWHGIEAKVEAAKASRG